MSERKNKMLTGMVTDFKFARIALPKDDNLASPEIEKEIQAKIYKAMLVESNKLWIAGDKPRSHIYDTSTLRTSWSVGQQSLTKEKLDEIYDTFFNPQKAFDRRLRQAIIDTLTEAGLHPDSVERVTYALDSTVGKEAMQKLTVDECKDVEHLAQKFLKIYRDETS